MYTAAFSIITDVRLPASALVAILPSGRVSRGAPSSLPDGSARYRWRGSGAWLGWHPLRTAAHGARGCSARVRRRAGNRWR